MAEEKKSKIGSYVDQYKLISKDLSNLAKIKQTGTGFDGFTIGKLVGTYQEANMITDGYEKHSKFADIYAQIKQQQAFYIGCEKKGPLDLKRDDVNDQLEERVYAGMRVLKDKLKTQ